DLRGLVERQSAIELHRRKAGETVGKRDGGALVHERTLARPIDQARAFFGPTSWGQLIDKGGVWRSRRVEAILRRCVTFVASVWDPRGQCLDRGRGDRQSSRSSSATLTYNPSKGMPLRQILLAPLCGHCGTIRSFSSTSAGSAPSSRAASPGPLLFFVASSPLTPAPSLMLPTFLPPVVPTFATASLATS